jgi:hypothetical protein
LLADEHCQQLTEPPTEPSRMGCSSRGLGSQQPVQCGSIRMNSVCQFDAHSIGIGPYNSPRKSRPDSEFEDDRLCGYSTISTTGVLSRRPTYLDGRLHQISRRLEFCLQTASNLVVQPIQASRRHHRLECRGIRRPTHAQAMSRSAETPRLVESRCHRRACDEFQTTVYQ